MLVADIYELSGYWSSNDTKIVLCSLLTQGPAGVFGWCARTDAVEEGEAEHNEFVFVEWDLHQNTVQETKAFLPYRYVHDVHVEYDRHRDCWLLSVNGLVRALPGNGSSYSIPASDLYTISRSQPLHWSEPSRVPKVKPGEGEDQMLQSVWIQGEQYWTLLKGYCDLDAHTRLYHHLWNTIDPGRLLERGFFFVPVIFEKTFLILSCVFQRKSSQWGYRIAAYQTDGTRLRQGWIPAITYTSKQERSYEVDDFDWLQPQFVVCEGPVTRINGEKTCVAAIFLHEYARHARRAAPHRAEESPDPLSLQGGLYWLDEQGHLLSRETSPCGEQIQLCLCEEEIIGVDRWNRQWRLWSWSPYKKKPREIHAQLSPKATRVDVLGMQAHDASSQGGFWCIEEDPEGFTISLWSTESFERLEQLRVDGMQLPSRLSGGVKALAPCGSATYKEQLLLLGMNAAGQLKLLKVSPD